MPHLELAAGDRGRSDDFKIGYRYEVHDLEFALANDRQRRRFYAPHPDHPSGALSQDYGCGAGEGEIVDLVGLPTRDGGGIQSCILGVGLCLTKSIADRLGVLRGEQDPHYLTAILVMLEDLLADQLTLAIAVRGQPHPLCRT
jgi:hypothetical protein